MGQFFDHSESLNMEKSSFSMFFHWFGKHDELLDFDVPSAASSASCHRPGRLGQLVPYLHCLELGAEVSTQAASHPIYGDF